MRLNENQMRVVAATTNIACVAIPGSGKTATSVAKASKLLQEDKNNVVCMVAFNATAAQEIKERIIKHGADPERIIAGTYHALALQQQKNAGIKIPKIVVGATQQHIQTKAWIRANKPCELNEIGQIIDRCKISLALGEPVSSEYEILVKYYQNMMIENNVMDFTDIIVNAVKGMMTGSISPLSITHIIADEFQDTDAIQLAWLAAHLKLCRCTIIVVGDDDQSIYGFRRALGFSAFQYFMSAFEADIYRLEENYRSHSEILEVAERLIKNNESRIQKRLISSKGRGGSVTYHEALNKQLEHDTLCDFIEQNDPQNMAILVRRNDIAANVEKALTERGIRCTRNGGESFWDNDIIQAVLTAIDSVNSKTLIGDEQFLVFLGIDHDIAEDLVHKEDPTARDSEYRKVQAKYKRLIELRGKHSKNLKSKEDNTVNTALREIAEFIVMERAQWNDASKEKRFKDKVRHVVDILCRWKGTWSRRRKNIKEKNSTEDSNITILTMHLSKGLEFPLVWIFNCSEGVMPPKGMVDEQEIEEERRIMYVAVTRAERDLHISFNEEPSRFVVEMMQEL